MFKPVSWTEALFLNERANNQIWCSIEARVAHVDLARDPPEPRPTRFPSECCGCRHLFGGC